MEKKVNPVMKFLVKRKYNGESGYSLVELLLVLVLMFLVVAAITLTYFTSANANNTVISTATSEIDARTALYIMERELREATGISHAGQDRVTFTSDINSDDTYEEVSYYLSTQNGYYDLIKAVGGGDGKVILSKVVNPDFFSYYSQLEQELDFPISGEQLNNIKIVEINISVDQSGGQSSRTMDLNTKLTLRNNI
ncbi:MAG: hypothetical protein R6U35_07675 [Candidatus Humimicrobiaceae bacterium]